MSKALRGACVPRRGIATPSQPTPPPYKQEVRALTNPRQWQQGQDVIIAGSVSDEQAKEIFGEWESPNPHVVAPAT